MDSTKHGFDIDGHFFVGGISLCHKYKYQCTKLKQFFEDNEHFDDYMTNDSCNSLEENNMIEPIIISRIIKKFPWYESVINWYYQGFVSEKEIEDGINYLESRQ